MNTKQNEYQHQTATSLNTTQLPELPYFIFSLIFFLALPFSSWHTHKPPSIFLQYQYLHITTICFLQTLPQFLPYGIDPNTMGGLTIHYGSTFIKVGGSITATHCWYPLN